MSVKTSHYNIVLFGVKTDTYDLYNNFKDDIDLVVTLDDEEIKNFISIFTKINFSITRFSFREKTFRYG